MYITLRLRVFVVICCEKARRGSQEVLHCVLLLRRRLCSWLMLALMWSCYFPGSSPFGFLSRPDDD
jgi:hypothetical protein